MVRRHLIHVRRSRRWREERARPGSKRRRPSWEAGIQGVPKSRRTAARVWCQTLSPPAGELISRSLASAPPNAAPREMTRRRPLVSAALRSGSLLGSWIRLHASLPSWTSAGFPVARCFRHSPRAAGIVYCASRASIPIARKRDWSMEGLIPSNPSGGERASIAATWYGQRVYSKRPRSLIMAATSPGTADRQPACPLCRRARTSRVRISRMDGS